MEDLIVLATAGVDLVVSVTTSEVKAINHVVALTHQVIVLTNK